MSTQLIDRIRAIVDDGAMSRSGLARAAGLHANSLRDLDSPGWNPTAETLRKLENWLAHGSDLSPMASPEEIIAEARNGRMFILVDDEDRENEGDLIIPAQMATPDAINFMATHGRGLICLAMTRSRVEALGLELMSRNNGTRHETAFTVSIEAREGVTTGISAGDRARTVSVAIDASKGRDDIVTPGHVFPLIARDGGVLVRAGHTEASVDIARLAGLTPAGVICEIMNEDGTMARLDDLIPFARRHGLKIGTIAELIAYRSRSDRLVECVSDEPFESDYGGDWRLKSYRNKIDGSVNMVLQKGAVDPEGVTLVRMHPVSLFDDLMGRPGPKKRRLQRSMDAIGEAGAGVIVLLMRPLPGSAAAEAAPPPSGGMDLRTYGIGAQILADLGVHAMELLTPTHSNLVGLEGYGLSIVGERAIPGEA
ncbi:3,4-dihydroxy-2-butanone-4-phosphate synthase [Sphingopyxis indica]|uniref:3,4-dihydroxy-2-butanone 4-phosphate synthase n=1 Tax=Sphingopyxis indica TaxID=436663 RepID=A0A239HTJ8_9SPHN|nr:3,4-dihydroxy-2-butanone-4-phosphate synthase [Sphingopyxis indica]WOF43125.1 3,4-dihydroxy-2-butanone-4-phosphate synthase [Sphingopyxis indica]SNS84535.1 3,4-dihydroxy-2-butanone 4-phosphate synthase /GTP cyclohydrolase II [Sphingopyxis indica]